MASNNILKILLIIAITLSFYSPVFAETSAMLRVTDPDGLPLENVSVFINLKYPENIKPIHTDAKGEVMPDPARTGAGAVVTVFKSGYFPATAELGTGKAVTIQLKKVEKRLAVSVYDKKGKPLQNIAVAVGSKTAETDRSGIAGITLDISEKKAVGKIQCSKKETKAFSVIFGEADLYKETKSTCITDNRKEKKDKGEKAASKPALKKAAPEPVRETRKTEKPKTESPAAPKPASLPASSSAAKKADEPKAVKPAEASKAKPAQKPVETARLSPALQPEAVKVSPVIALATEKLEECRAYFREGKFVKAAEVCGEIPDERTTLKIYAEAVHVRGLSFLRMDWRQEAKKEFQKILERVPNYAASNLELGVMNVTEGKSADALSYLISAHAGNTQLGSRDKCRLFLFTAKAYEQLSNYTEAKKYMRGLLELKNCSESDRKSAADMLDNY